jgi:hypothetical protein
MDITNMLIISGLLLAVVLLVVAIAGVVLMLVDYQEDFATLERRTDARQLWQDLQHGMGRLPAKR